MFTPRFALALTMLASTLVWVGVTAVPASAAIVTKQTIDGFGAGATGSASARTWAPTTGSISHVNGTTTLTAANGNSNVATLTYTFSSSINLAANAADALVLNHPQVTNDDPTGNSGFGWVTTLTDTAGATSAAGATRVLANC